MALRKDSVNSKGLDGKACLCRGPSNASEHHVETPQRNARPVQADLAEHAALDRIVFGTIRRVVAQRNFKTQYPNWNNDLDTQLRKDYGPEYDRDRAFIRHAYEYRYGTAPSAAEQRDESRNRM